MDGRHQTGVQKELDVKKKEEYRRPALTLMPELAAISTNSDTMKNPLQLSPPGKENIKSMFLYLKVMLWKLMSCAVSDMEKSCETATGKIKNGESLFFSSFTHPISISLKRKWKKRKINYKVINLHEWLKFTPDCFVTVVIKDSLLTMYVTSRHETREPSSPWGIL